MMVAWTIGGSTGVGSKGTVFADRVDLRYESKRAFRTIPKFFGPSKWQDGVYIN